MVLLNIVKYCNDNPGLEVQDLCKYLYQSIMGCSHFVGDMEKAFEYIKEEYENNKLDILPEIEEIDGNYCRIHLKAIGHLLSINELANYFYETSKDKTGNIEELEKAINDLIKLAEKKDINFDSNEIRKFVCEWKKQGYMPVSHSKNFKELYHPSYRVINKRFLEYIKVD